MKRTRQIILLALISALLLALVPAASMQDETITLRLAWWGGDARHELYNRIADMYEELNPNIKLEREFGGWGPYWDLLATQTAGGNMPDILHMHVQFVNDYANRGALGDLQPFAESGAIDLSNWVPAIVDSGRSANGDLVMLTLGNSSPGTHWNTRLFAEAGVEPPTEDWTWTDFQQTAIALSEALGPDVWGTEDSGAWEPAFETWLRQRGKDLFQNGTELGFDKEDLMEWWAMWEEMRAAGALPPADLSQEYSGSTHSDSMLARGMVAMLMMSGNQHKLYQNQMEDELNLAVIPRGDAPDSPGGDVLGGAYVSMSATTRYPEEVAAFIDWFINDPDVALLYNNEHGPIGNMDNQALVEPNLDPSDQRLSQMMAIIASESGNASIRPSWGTEAIVSTFQRVYDELAFGRLSLEEAVDFYFDEVDFISS